MIFYCVTTQFFDDGMVTAHITNHAGIKDESELPPNSSTSRREKDIYKDYFISKEEAIAFCDEAKRA